MCLYCIPLQVKWHQCHNYSHSNKKRSYFKLSTSYKYLHINIVNVLDDWKHFKMLYMNVLLRATVWQRKMNLHCCLSSVSATFWHQYAALPVPINPHAARDYQHLSGRIKIQVSQINGTAEISLDICKGLSPRGLSSGGGSAPQTDVQKEVTFSVKAPLIKKSKKMCSPVMTASKLLIHHSLILKLSVLSLSWNLSLSSCVWSWTLEICSISLRIAPRWVHRWWEAVCRPPQSLPCTPRFWLFPSVLKQQCPSNPPQML